MATRACAFGDAADVSSWEQLSSPWDQRKLDERNGQAPEVLCVQLWSTSMLTMWRVV